MGYTLMAHIELPKPCLENPEKNGIVAQKVGMDLDIIDENGHELNSDEVIASGFAWMSRFGFKNEAGEEVILFEGRGASADRFKARPDVVRQMGHDPREGKSIPNPGYTENGSAISALEDSNGLRMFPNFKKLPPGYYTGFAEVKGIGAARFRVGKTFRIGKAKPKPTR